MRVLFINQFYAPDEAATAQLLGDVVAGIARDAGVVCGASSYAGGTSAAFDSVAVRRVPAPAFGHGRVRKLWSYGGFYSGALLAALRAPRPEVVVTMTTPPLLGLIGLALQKMRGARHFIWEMDVYPDIANELGVFQEGGVVDRIVGWLADWPRRKADGVIVLGPCMAARIQGRGVDASRIHICHNWADGEAVRPQPFAEDGRLKVLYSGNFGLAHDFDTVAGALRILGKDPQFEFLFSGGGPQLWRLKAICEENGYTSCRFQGFQPREALGGLLAGCDVGLVTQKDGTEGAVVPSKTYGLMAAGRPVAYVGPDSATPAWLIEEHRAGWRFANGDVEGLVSCLRALRACPESYQEAGRRARLAFEEHYDLKIGVSRFLQTIGVPKLASKKFDR